MKHSILAITILATFILAALGMHSVDAQENDLDLDLHVDYQFGSHISFVGTLQSSDEIARAVVFMRPNPGDGTRVLEAVITESAAIQHLEASTDLRISPIQPFANVTYWWQVDFVDGTTASSHASEFRYDDNRFQWRQYSQDRIAIFWVEGEQSRAEDLLLITQDTLNILRQTLGLAPPDHVAIYLYPSIADLQSGLRIGGAPWIGAHTLPELGVVLLAASNGPESLISLERDLPHELTHLLLFHRMGESYANLPAWLNEGLATLQEKQVNPAYRFELEQAVEADALLTTESLCSSFPIAESDALLAYAQSASFTQYLLDVYGMGGILQLLDAYQEGTTCTGGVQRVYQRPLTQLEQEWKRVHLQSPTIWQRLIPIMPWGLLIIPIVLLVLIGFAARKKHADPTRG